MMEKMMCNYKHSVLFFILTLTIYINSGHAQKNQYLQKNCEEFNITPVYELHCPPGNDNLNGINEGFVIKFKNDEIEVICAPNLKNSEMINSLNSINNSKSELTKLKMKICPLPSNIQKFVEKVSSKNLTLLNFLNSNQSKISLGKKNFEGLTTLKDLKLKSNQFRRLEVDVFYNTQNLMELDLAENELAELPDNIFRELKILENLHLETNKLTKLTSLSFFGLEYLKRLDLRGNKLSNIEEDTFKNLTNLETLDLTNNKLTLLSSNLFKYNKHLNYIRICNNINLLLPNNFLTNLTNLQKVYLSESNLKAIPNDVFRGSNKIEIINLSGNSLKVLPDDLLKDLENLKELHLNDNNFNILVAPFRKLKKLTFLNLNDNSLKSIEKDLFTDLTALEKLYLNRNEIFYINSHAFLYNGNLKEIHAANNNYSPNFLQYELFGVSINLEVVDFSHNKIRILESVITLNSKLHLKHLDLSYNHLESLIVAELQPVQSHDTVINLEHNDIAKVDFQNVDQISRENSITYTTNVLLSNNPLVCDCLNYDLLRYLQRNFSSKVYDILEIKMENVTCSQLPNVLFEELEFINITCPPEQLSLNLTCPEHCQCLARPFDKSYIVDCSNRGLSNYPTIEFTPSSMLNQVELNLEFNNFTNGPSSVEIEKYYSNVTRLYLSNNFIRSITSLPAKLQILKLNNNSLERLDDEFLELLNTSRTIFNLTFDGNPWICECQTENFAQYLRTQSKKVDSSSIFCANTHIPIIDMNRNSLCKEWNSIFLTVVITLIFFLVCASIIAVYYRYQNEIKVWLYSKQLCLWCVTEEEIDKDKIYDAFISYSHRDENFVTEHIISKLESFSYQICLHFRDWIVGEFIATQITDSVCQSRRTIIILSSNFVESEWGRVEFKAAHTQAMKDGRTRVIVILYGDVDDEKLDEELKTYLRTNTYIRWDDPLFWDKLKYALPHLKNTRNNNFKNYGENNINAIIKEGSLNSSTLLLSSNIIEKQHGDFI